MKCLRFLNADEIAKGLSPFDSSAAAVQAARILLTEIKKCLRCKETFALESTLSGKTYIRLLREAKEKGGETELNYLWLSSPAQAIARVLLDGQNVIRQNQAHKLPLILWLDGKLVEKEV